MSGSMSFVPPAGSTPAARAEGEQRAAENQTLLASPASDGLLSPTMVPLAADEGDITGLGNHFTSNAHLSRYSQASSLNSEALGGGRSGSAMGLSTRSVSGLVDDGDSATGLYAAPIPFGNRATSSSPLGPNNSSGAADGGDYALAAPDSPSLGKEGFDLTSAEKYERSARAGYAADRANGGVGGAGAGGGFANLWHRRKALVVGGGLLTLAVIVGVAVGVPVALKNNKATAPVSALTPEQSSSASAASASRTGSASAAPSATPVVLAKFGTNGSNVILSDGTEGFEYRNDFGGYWGWDADRPFDTSSGGRAQSWSPALNETFNYGVDRVRGVNLGGWLNTEPFIVPGLYERYYPDAVDEFSLTTAMGANMSAEMEEHYATFVTERDFMEIAAAGFNYVRIPIGFWAIETEEGEPFLQGVSWTYFLKAIEWARKYGLRINLDLHAVPGSQNGWNHSGKMNNVNFLWGQMGIANAQRTLNIIRSLTQFISQEQYRDVVPMFGVVNEPFATIIGADPIKSFYTAVYDLIREITGVGEGKGPWIVIHDAMTGIGGWAGYLENADRLSLDHHPYFAFDTPHTGGVDSFAAMACNTWGPDFNNSMRDFGFTQGGEFSFAVNDCGLWVTGVDLGTRWEGTFDGFTTSQGSCEPWTDWTSWDDATKQGLLNFMLASMDALNHNYFFWTWKIGNSSQFSYTPNPMWNYQLGLAEGWAPKDPRAAEGFCASIGISNSAWDGSLAAWQTGGAGAGDDVVTSWAWPPASMTSVSGGQMTSIPQLTTTGVPVTLPGPTYTGSSTTYDAGSGWFNAQDTAAAYAKVSGCTYPDTWADGTKAPGASACGAGVIPTAVLRKRAEPEETAAAAKRFSRER